MSLHPNPTAAGGFVKGAPLNHIGIAVDPDAEEALFVGEGLDPFSHGGYVPGTRSFYFFDGDGIELEVLSYAAPPAN